MQPLLPQTEAALQQLLPPGSRITQALPLADGSIALAWVNQEAARTGVALAQPGGGHRLWTAVTQQETDVAAASKISVIRLPGLPEEVLVSAYETEGCCAWVNLFALSHPPRVLFGSPTTSSRLLAGHILVQKRPLGDYLPGTPLETEIHTWNGRSFALSGLTLAPHHYFPLAAGMRWRYQSDGGVVERWVQQQQRDAEGRALFTLRSLLRTGSGIRSLPETRYTYGPEGEVLERSPVARLLLPSSPGIGSEWRPTGQAQARVTAIEPQIRVAAGAFQNVLVVEEGRRRLYYAPHVGLIREEEDGKVLLELLQASRPAGGGER